MKYSLFRVLPGVALIVTTACGSNSLRDDGAVVMDMSGGADAMVDVAQPPPVFWDTCDTSEWPIERPKPGPEVECAVVEVPLDYAKPTGEKITLRVARQRSKSYPTGRAIFYLEGGPGGSAVESSGVVPGLLPEVLGRFDFVYVDQRGSGGSSYLGCKGGFPSSGKEWEACAEEYAGVDFSHFSTMASADDIETVRRLLGYESIAIYGVSYGTRLALEVMRRHSNVVSAVALDGISPPDMNAFRDVLAGLDRGVERLVDDCEADPACLAVSPQLRADLLARRQELRDIPRSVSIGGVPLIETERVYLLALEQLIANDVLRAKVPRAIHLAADGRVDDWNDLLGTVFGLHGGAFSASAARLAIFGRYTVAPGLYIAVACAEWVPNAGETGALYQVLEGQTWMDRDLFDRVAKAEACAAWPIAPLPAEARAPVRSPVKALLLNGDLDINTFPENGAHVLEGLANGTNIVVPFATHIVSRVPCAQKILNAFFVAEGEIEEVDTSCLDDLAPTPW